MKISLLIIPLYLFTMISCAPPKEQVDLVVHNAKVYTVDSTFSVGQAFAVRDGKFVAVGTGEDILAKYTAKQSVNAEGKPVYPGFYDAHCHFFGYGMNLITRADLVGTTSFEEVIDRLKKHHEQYPAEWIEGRGWDQNDWQVKEFPTKDMLDKVFPDIPVYLIRVDGHACLINSEALKRAGIDAGTRVEGGEIMMKDGQPTGVLLDNAMDLVSDIIPKVDEKSEREALLEAQENCFAVGLTSVADAGLGLDTVLLIDRMQKEGSLKMRVYAMLTPTAENLSHFVEHGPYKTERLTVRSIKLYADGALGSRGAKMIEPYTDDPGNTGLYMHPESYYMDFCMEAYNNGYQVNTHAIGDAGNRFVLDIYGQLLPEGNDLRWRIEHAQVIDPADFDRFGRYGIIPSVQPTHATSDMYWAEERLGPERIKGAYAYKQLLDENGWIPLGTDFPVEDINPMLTFSAAVARRDKSGGPEGGFQTENALSLEEALKGITLWAAMAGFEEGKKGSIEAGKYADFVIMDRDIMDINIDEVPGASVIATFVGGEKVYDNQPE